MSESRGRIAFSATYRPLVPLDLFAVPIPPTSRKDELYLSDGKSFNYNAKAIPPTALKLMLKRPMLASHAKEHDVDKGRVSGLCFVSERTKGLETLHIALRFDDGSDTVKVFCFADVYGTFDGCRMEDSACFGGDYIVYVSTMEPSPRRRQPWTAVYKTNLKTGETQRLTPSGQADLSPSVSPNGKMVAVASFEKKGGWDGEIDYLRTDIFVMSLEEPSERKLVIEDGGWPTWGSENILFFHRQVASTKKWGVFRADINKGLTSYTPERVTPDDIDAITPVAIDDTTVAVITIREKADSHSDAREELHYRHVEIFDSTGHEAPKPITQSSHPKADHYNPFLIVHSNGAMQIGYHRSKHDLIGPTGNEAYLTRPLDEVHSPHTEVGLFRVAGIFPAFSRDGYKLAYVDNEFKEVWIANKDRAHKIYTASELNSIFSPVWNQNPEKHILYVCMGPAFKNDHTVNICAIDTAATSTVNFQPLTKGFNNAFPSTNPEGTRVVFRSTRGGGDGKYKNLYIMEDAQLGEFGEGKITRLTNGPWIDTHCEWSPRGDWITFSSTRDKPKDAPELDPNACQDPGWYAAFIVSVDKPDVVVRVVHSADDIAGHVNHPFFSPDMKNMVITADLAAVSCDPISLPHFLHSVRPYGDIFMVDIDTDEIQNNKDLKTFKRITHSKYENGIATWSASHTKTEHHIAAWGHFVHAVNQISAPICPFVHPDGGQGWHMTGHLCIPKRQC